MHIETFTIYIYIHVSYLCMHMYVYIYLIYHIYIYIIYIHYPFNLLIFPSPFFPSFPVPSHASAIKLTWPGPATVENGHRSFKNVGTSGAEFCQVCVCFFFSKRWLTLKRRVVLFFSHHWCPKGSPGWMFVFFHDIWKVSEHFRIQSNPSFCWEFFRCCHVCHV